MNGSFSKIINRWFQKNQHLFFRYSKGFYHLNYVANSPFLMLESFKKMMFCKYDETQNTIHTNSPFNKGTLQYAFLEDGLVLLNSELTYKKNVCYHRVIDKEVPNDYYTLSFNVFSHPTSSQGIKIDSFVFSDKKWILSKPTFLSEVSYLKDSYNESIIIYFSRQWFEDYIKKDTAFENSKIKSFFDSEQDVIVWPDNAIELSNIANSIKKILATEGISNPLQLKFKTYELIATFIRNYSPDNIFKNYKNLHQKDIVKMNQIEFYLVNNIYSSFMGIDALSTQFHISPTKLKSNFKAIYGTGIFNYFRNKQMHLAKELLESGDYRVKEVAQLFGYENTSRFSQAFKSVTTVLPSDVIFKR